MVLDLALLACDGCFKGYPAVISLVIIALLLVGGIYVLLASNFGARVGYLVTATSFFAFLLILSLLWLIGAPGTTTATGPRGREPAWVAFLGDSAVGTQDFGEAVRDFPQGWDPIGEIYPGNIDSQGEFEAVKATVTGALANKALVEETGDPTTTAAYDFRLPGPVLIETDTPEATQLAYRHEGNSLLFGVTIPASDDHREITVFAFRDKGLVYLYALYFLVISLIGFAGHLWLLVRAERAQEERDQALEAETVTVDA